MEHTHSQNQEEASAIAMNWLKAKMRERFERDFNLDDEVVIVSGDTLKAALTPETSKLSQPESLGLSFYVNHINSGDLNPDQMVSEINEIK
ncbi:hypothetical protein [Chryseobacterium hagamense]|uniref:Uncharacterized protein n=1 Tax=Chryseobacterium hagamense TaxID=395935 RepID=A0A511YL59_9FLAO|nr:hypothetical protein [Chryseobacterium hagamense]GEN75920.1 hypothetical protein CHA01nite_16600 [Chryseobacterium hagamense]